MTAPLPVGAMLCVGERRLMVWNGGMALECRPQRGARHRAQVVVEDPEELRAMGLPLLSSWRTPAIWLIDTNAPRPVYGEIRPGTHALQVTLDRVSVTMQRTAHTRGIERSVAVPAQGWA